ncbi:MAG: uracil permease, partial [Bacilli bacterium]|nr:uracil permease [Bacilli bacterium]
QGPGAAMFGAICSGIVYLIIALIIAKTGSKWLTRILPPVVVGPIIIVIGLGLSGTAVTMAQNNWLIAFIAIVVAIVASMFFRGFLGVIPILIGIIVGYIVAAALGQVDFAKVAAAPIFQIPHFTAPVVSSMAVWMIAPVALVSIAEHVGHLLVTQNIVGRNLIKDPGLHRSLFADGVATTLAGLVGGPPQTTYGENIGVMAITRVYSVRVIGGAAVIAIILSFIGKLNALISSIPVPVMGGISILLFGIIAAQGLRMLAEAGVDYSQKRNLLIASVIMVLGVGNAVVHIGQVEIGGMALATFAGILLNLVLPQQDAK